MAAKDGESACKQVTEFAMTGSAVIAVIGLLTGVAYNGAACDMNLSEWNLVNCVLAGAVAFTSYFAIKVSPKALSLGYKCLSFDISFNELVAEGILPASVSIGQALMPLLALIWSIHGLSGIRYGTCASTAPFLFGVSATEMLIQAIAILASAGYIMNCAGFSLEKLKQMIMGLASKIKNMAIEAFDKAVALAKSAYEIAAKHAKQFAEKVCDLCKNCCCCIPKCMTPSYWRGAEGRPLLG